MSFFTRNEVEVPDAEWRDEMQRLRAMHGPAPVRDEPKNRARRHALMSSLPGRVTGCTPQMAAPRKVPRQLSAEEKFHGWLLLATVAVFVILATLFGLGA